MTLTRRPSPFSELVTLRQAMDRLFDDTVFRPLTAYSTQGDLARLPLDVRTTPAVAPVEVVRRIRGALTGSELEVRSDRFAPRETAPGPLLDAARAARPGARSYGSATLSDWALLPAGVPALKVGPGLSERSHTPDEFVLASEIVDGARFYVELVRQLAARLRRDQAAEGAA